MTELIEPTTALHRSWLASLEDWGRGVHQDGSGIRDFDDFDSPEGFARFVRRLHDEADPDIDPEPGRVDTAYWWMAEGDTILGSISLRHELNDFLLEQGGNIGYGVRPSARGRGLAGWALHEVLGKARDRGLSKALVTCHVTNPASRRVIERAGGVFEDIRDGRLGPTRRYWFDLR
ncbi:GNAT family N-acetyltransferase [Actinoplanes sp. NBRC 103695]|uniref:GNAT family N-acetyltransferase n=1 Tax=Actinoplanes sp. NBRC 103695 TaxID=3032202 RepID=UPI0024A0EC53|nr:GNAT family N-acetyltransferase [Actinoplanes sp. NBRC 103695]GLZ00365.1 acetyltransferase [Actinoplanes sp. NBRC 103695]